MSKKQSIFDKLTDPKLYTGAHRHRFDPETGKGRGKAGRVDKEDKVKDLSQITRPNLHPHEAHAYLKHNEQKKSTTPSKKSKAAKSSNIFDKLTDPSLYTGSHKERFDPTTGKGKGLAGRYDIDDPSTQKKKKPSKKGGSIFDKLTDPSLYTGAHKHRFDPTTGKGLGLAGRDRIAKGSGTVQGYSGGNVSDLSQITRPNLN